MIKSVIVRPTAKNSALYEFVERHDYNRGDLTSIKLQCQQEQSHRKSNHARSNAHQRSKPRRDSWQDVSRKIRIIDATYIRNHFDDTIPDEDEDAQVLSQTIQLLKPSHTALAGGVLAIPYDQTQKFIDHYALDVAKDMKNNWQSRYDQHGQHSLSEFGYAEAFPFFLDWDAYFGHTTQDGILSPVDQDLILLVVKICQAAIRRYYASVDDRQWKSVGSVCVTQTLPRVAQDQKTTDQNHLPFVNTSSLLSASSSSSSSSMIPFDLSDSNASWLTDTIPDMMSEHSRSSMDLANTSMSMPDDSTFKSDTSIMTSNVRRSTSLLSLTSSIGSIDTIKNDMSPNNTVVNKHVAAQMLYGALNDINTSADPSRHSEPDPIKHITNMNTMIPVTNSEIITTKRYKVGIHIHFWKLIVNVDQAKILRNICIAELASNLNYNHAYLASSSLQYWGPFKDMSYARSSLQFASKVWEAMMDEFVYHPLPHCRMFGSHKVVRKLCEHCKRNRNYNCITCGGGRALSEGHEAMVDLSYMLDGLGDPVDDQRLNQLIDHQYQLSFLHDHLQKYPCSIWKGRGNQVTLIHKLHAPYKRMMMSSATMEHLIKYIKFVLGRTMIRLPIDPVTSVFERHVTPGFDPSVDGSELPPDAFAMTKTKSRDQLTILINVMCENALIQEIRKLNPAWSALNFSPFILKQHQWMVECHGVGSKTCTLAQKTHSVSRIYFIITPVGITQGCHSTKPRLVHGPCTRNKRSRVWPCPTKLLKILFPNATDITVKPKYNTAYTTYDRVDKTEEWMPPAKRICQSLSTDGDP